MGRQVGSFTIPGTTQEAWVEMDNLKKLPLIPDQVTRFKDIQNSVISYRFEPDETTKTVQLFAEYRYQGETLVSSPAIIPEDIFTKQLADCVFAYNTVDIAPTVVEAKEKAVQSIAELLLKQGAILGNSIFSGIGFICSDEARIMTIEKLHIIAHQNGTADIRLIDCVGNADLKNVVNPSIEFFTDDYKITIPKYSIEEDSNELLRNYVVTTADIDTELVKEKISYEIFDLNKDDEASVERFLTSRRGLLTQESREENILEERFADIFFDD